MPNIKIVNETSRPLRVAMLLGPAPTYFNNEVPAGGSFDAHVASACYAFEACTTEGGNEYCAGDSLARAGIMAGAVAAGTASVVVGSMWALGSFGGHFFAPGRAAFGAAGGLWAAAHAAGAASASRTGVVFKVDQWVGFQDLRFAIRLKEGCHVLVNL